MSLVLASVVLGTECIFKRNGMVASIAVSSAELVLNAVPFHHGRVWTLI